MSESTNNEITIESEKAMGGSRDIIKKLHSLSVETGSLACLGCKSADGWMEAAGEIRKYLGW